jgi:hypothetical protein
VTSPETINAAISRLVEKNFAAAAVYARAAADSRIAGRQDTEQAAGVAR